MDIESVEKIEGIIKKVDNMLGEEGKGESISRQPSISQNEDETFKRLSKKVDSFIKEELVQKDK